MNISPTPTSLSKLLETAKIIPAVNQIEMHPYQAQPDLIDFCRQKGIATTAYSPTGYASIANDPTIIKLSEKYKVSPAQISLAWILSRGSAAIPKSTNVERQRGNLFVSLVSSRFILFTCVRRFRFLFLVGENDV